MGDPRGFDALARVVTDRFPRSSRVADVAGGKGYLQAALRLHGFRDVVSWDIRSKYASGRPGYHYGLFNFRTAPSGYTLVVGMHPDQGTDHIVQYACLHRVPFVVCPCCVMPSATDFGGRRGDYHDWMRHLRGFARSRKMHVESITIPMAGRNQVLIGTPL